MKVILPCAGKGTRLGLPYPKEMHLIAKQTALIDLTFKRLENHSDLISEVIIILAPEKASLVEYLAKWKERFYLKFVFFDDRNHEWAGSILSAEQEFGEKNLVFLPDTFLVGLPEFPIVPTFDTELEKNSVCFGYLPTEDRKTLKSLGALKVVKDQVEGFCDKPAENNPAYFNAFWTTFGFKQDVSRPLLELMTRSIQGKPVDLRDVSSAATAFPVKEYKDLGVWPNIVEFTKRLGENEAPFPAF